VGRFADNVIDADGISISALGYAGEIAEAIRYAISAVE